MARELPKIYEPQQVEDRIYKSYLKFKISRILGV